MPRALKLTFHESIFLVTSSRGWRRVGENPREEIAFVEFKLKQATIVGLLLTTLGVQSLILYHSNKHYLELASHHGGKKQLA